MDGWQSNWDIHREEAIMKCSWTKPLKEYQFKFLPVLSNLLAASQFDGQRCTGSPTHRDFQPTWSTGRICRASLMKAPARPGAPIYLPSSTTCPPSLWDESPLFFVSVYAHLDLDVLPHHVEAHLLHPFKIPSSASKRLTIHKLTLVVLLLICSITAEKMNRIHKYQKKSTI